MDRQSDWCVVAEEALSEEERRIEKEEIDHIFILINECKSDKRSVNDVFKSLRQYLQIDGCDYIRFIDKKEKDEILENLESDLRHNCSSRPQIPIEHSEIISKSSTVNGIFLTKKQEDWTKVRFQVINKEECIVFKSIASAEIKETLEFFADSESRLFQSCLEKFGWGYAMNASLAGFDKPLKKIDSSDKTGETGIPWNSVTYLNKSTCITVPVAFWKPSIDDICLTKNVVKHLKKIENLSISNKPIFDHAREFFHEFGSHVYVGDIHLGGTFMVATEYHSTQHLDISVVQPILSEMHATANKAVDNFVSPLVLADEASKKCTDERNIKGKLEEKVRQNIQTRLVKFGGPIEVNSFQLWKKGLKNNGENYVVVNGGRPSLYADNLELDNYLGIWDLVIKEDSYFKDPLSLAVCLVAQWEVLTGFKADKTRIHTYREETTKKNFFVLVDKIKVFLQSHFTQSAYLTALKNLKKAIAMCTETEGCKHLLQGALTSGLIFQELFNRVASVAFSENEIIEIGRIWHQILDDVTLNIKFPKEQNVITWLLSSVNTKSVDSMKNEKIESVKDFFIVLKGIYKADWHYKYEIIKVNKERENLFIGHMSSVIASHILEILNHFEDKKDSISYIIFTSLVLHLDFDIKEKQWKCSLTKGKLQKIQKTFEEKQSKITRYLDEIISIEVQQAFAFHELIETIISQESPNVSPEARSLEIITHIFGLDFNFHENIAKCSLIDTDNMLRRFHEIIEGTDRKTISWNYFENLLKPVNIHAVLEKEADSGETNPIWDFLNLFDLIEYYPGKISLQDVIAIDDKPLLRPKHLSDIPWVILRNIISMNNSFRESVVDFYIRNVCQVLSEADDDDCFCENSKENDRDIKEEGLESLNPNDVFMSIFQCCDPFLKQTIVRNIAMCQLAVPFIFEDYSVGECVLSLWPLREVFTDSRSDCVATQPLKTISFIRVGSGLDNSKSKTINDLLRGHNEEYNTFFHRDCPLGMNKRTITNGLIEASWYVHGVDSDISETTEIQIKESLTILNLRGDADKFKNQVRHLLHLSNIIVVMINYCDLTSATFHTLLEMIHTSGCFVILLTDLSFTSTEDDIFIQEYSQKIDRARTKLVSNFDRKKKRKMNSNELKNTMKKQLSVLLSKTETGINIEDQASKYGILTDENDICMEMKAKAQQIYQQIKDKKECFYNKKSCFTPLQCDDLWCKWTRKQKEQTKPKNQAIYEVEETLLKEMELIRKQQVIACNDAPDILAVFVHTLLELVDQRQSVQYFLSWMRESMDKDSRIIIPKLLDEFILAYEQFESEELKTDTKRTRLDALETRLAEASFGLEHFFREVGQVYEAFMYCKDDSHYNITEHTSSIIHQLPFVVAKLLTMGQPIELMDGDAANVPLKWIRAVFDALSILLKNSKLFTVSVLGIQSSGKSTLLNAMFGLRFPVRAGRCTRGLFAQMIQMPSNHTSLKTCDYVMVIDTEGLRAPEHSCGNVNHDNELATLVVGIADLVIVNIKGETIAEMENVLQIVVHELLRLRQANKHMQFQQRCILIHQNVPAEDAKRQTLQGNKRTVEKLDKITKEVASQEGFKEIISFRDVIKFDPTKDVYFLPDLWQGSRPMAHVNSNYSVKAVNVREHILNLCSSQRSFLSIDNKILFIESLWKGIMAEDFVFSFRNSLEVKAYMLLESEFQTLQSALDFQKLQWMTNNIKTEFCKCENAEELDLQESKLNQKFRLEITLLKTEVEKKLEIFMEQSDLNEIMVQWKANKITSLHFTTDNILFEVEIRIKQEKQNYLMLLRKNDILVTNEKKIYRKAEQLALSCKGTDTTEEVKVHEFTNMWDTWVNELVPETSEQKLEREDKVLREDLKNILHQKYSENTQLVVQGLKKCPLDDLKEFKKLHERHLKAKHFTGQIRNLLSMGINTQPLNKVVNSILNNLNLYFELLFKQDTGYEKSHFRQIIDKIKTRIKECNDNPAYDFSFTRKFEVKLALHATRLSYHKFKIMNKNYEEKHGLRRHLQEQKQHAQQLFVDIFRAKSQEIIAANIISAKLKGLIKECIERNLPLQIQSQIVNKYFNTKSVLIKRILEELGHKEDFDEWMRYVESPEDYALRWITLETDSVVFNQKGMMNESLCEKWAKQNLEHLLEDLKEAVKVTSEKCTIEAETSSIDIRYWIKLFIKNIESNKLMVDANTFQLASECNISSFSEFGTTIIRELLGTIEKSLLEHIKQYSPEKIVWHDKTPYQNIFDAMWGCSAHCPICNEPCQKAGKNHASKSDCHTCIQHRPLGINGINHKENKKLVIESCDFKVQSSSSLQCGSWCGCRKSGSNIVYHPYKNYKDYIPAWDIAPSSDPSMSLYWNWFMCSNQDKLAKHYGRIIPDIPASWHKITKEKALKSLSKVYGIEIN